MCLEAFFFFVAAPSEFITFGAVEEQSICYVVMKEPFVTFALKTAELNFNLREWSLCFSHLCEAVWADFGQAGAQAEACFDTFLSLASVAEPYSDHLLLQMEPFGYPGYFL